MLYKRNLSEETQTVSKSTRKRNTSIKNIKLDVEEEREEERDDRVKVSLYEDMTMGDMIAELSDIKLKYDIDNDHLIQDYEDGKIDKAEIIKTIIKIHRDHNINSEMMTNKMIFVMLFTGLEIVAVRYLGLKDLAGVASYMCNKMPNFIEFMHFIASENVAKTANTVKDENYHYNKFVKMILLEFVIFICVSICKNSTSLSKIMNADLMDKISVITANDVKKNPMDNVMGYIASMVTGVMSNVNTDTADANAL